MSDYSLKTRSLISTWFSLIFFILLILYLLSIEFFRDSRNQKSIIDLLETPISESFIQNIIGIRFKNRIGSFTITKQEKNWILQKPRIIPAQKKTINLILNALRSIKVHTIHQHEPINFQSFSLDKPVLEISLLTSLDESIEVKVGLINPINSTSYMTVSGLDRIFQTNLFEGSLEGLELSDFIDGQVFSMELNQIKRIQIYHGKKTESFNDLSFDGNHWKSKKYNSISDKNVSKKLQSILDIKTHMIIDETNDELKNFIQNYREAPLYRLKITLNSGKSVTYNVSNLIKAISELKVDSRQYFIMHASDRSYPYILQKSFLNDFKVRYSDLR